MIPRFHALTLSTCTREKTAAPASVKLIDDEISVLLDEQPRARAAPTPLTENRHAWRMAVVDVHLSDSTRKPFVIKLRAAMNAVHGHASVRISAEGRTTSRQL